MTIDPDELIHSADAASLLHVKDTTLTAWRNQHRGPAYLKIGRSVYYRRCDLSEWLASQRRCPVAVA
jgi:predicted DNA-binding transcriptional regulator AlpA